PDAEKWGETSAVLRGTQNETQAARVVNENSAEFGFDGNYLQLFKETTASASVWVVAQNKIPGSEVMTAEFDYRRMGPASDGPFLRFGINDPIASTGSRVTSELRFIDTGFSGVPNLVKDNETHRIT